MVLYDPQEIGGLEEYVTTLAIGLQDQGHQVSILSAIWVSPENQYIKRLRENEVTIVHWPRWISYPASDSLTKERILQFLLWLFTPIVFALAGVHILFTRRSWRGSIKSARGWLHGRLLQKIIAPDRRVTLTRHLLNWWRIRWRPDLLHVQGYTTSLLFVVDWAYDRKLPVVYEEHQTPDPQFDWWGGFQLSINKASVVVAVSERSAKGLESVCGVTQPIVVRSPLLPDPQSFGWQKNSARDQQNQTFNLTTVARLDIAKGLNFLLEAIKLVQVRYPEAHFKVYGEGPLRQELLSHSKRLGLEGSSIFVGAFKNRQELDDIMAQTDIFVMSSILEGQPLAVVEAMAYGCPIVTTSVGGIPELIEDGVNGLLCAPKDPQCLAEKICALIEDPDLRKNLGKAARESYEQGAFQPAAVSGYFISIYERILAGEPVK